MDIEKLSKGIITSLFEDYPAPHMGRKGEMGGSAPRNAGTSEDVFKKLKAMGKEVLKGKGGFHIKGEGFISLAQARKITGIEAPERVVKPRISAWGDYATVAMINKVKI